MIDSNRRTILTTGVAAAATAAASQVFAQAPQAGAPQQGRTAGRRQGRILREGQRPHPLRRDRLRLPAAGHARRRPELGHRRLAARGDQHHGGVQERLPRDHHGPAQCHRRRVHRPGPGRRSLGRVRRRPARRDGPSRHPPVFLLRQLHRRPVRDEADGARAAARRRRDAEPAGRAPAGEAGRHVRPEPGRLGQGLPRAPARRVGGDDREIPAQPLPACSPTSCTACRAISRSRARRRCWCCPTTCRRIRSWCRSTSLRSARTPRSPCSPGRIRRS